MSVVQLPALIEAPEPLTPPHCDLRAYRTMPLEVGRLRDSGIASHDNAEVFRAAVLLWCAAWHQVPCASLPNDDRELAKFAGFGRFVAPWLSLKEDAMHGFVLCSDGRWYHTVVAEIALESWETRKKFIKRSRAGNEAKAAKRGDPDALKASYKEPSSASEVKGSEGKGTEERTLPLRRDSGGGETGASPKKARRGDKRGTRLPIAWYATEKLKTYAAEHGFNEDEAHAVEEDFRDYWTAKAGKEARHVDWDRVWMRWVREERRRRDARARGTGVGGRGIRGTDSLREMFAGVMEAPRQRGGQRKGD